MGGSRKFSVGLGALGLLAAFAIFFLVRPGEPAVAGENWLLPADAVWLDLIEPTPEEDAAVEKALGLSVPTRAEMASIEASSRVYREGSATYLTADIVTHGDDEIEIGHGGERVAGVQTRRGDVRVLRPQPGLDTAQPFERHVL